MKSPRPLLLLAAALAAVVFPSRLTATNGMNMEGYGPIATALGGASFAYDNGTAAVINNPATLGLLTQGGMGCRYEGDTWRGLGFNLENRTEVSVGRVIAPLVWQVSDQLTLAATADFVWAGMDLKMAMSGAQFFDLADPRRQQFGRASGGIVNGFNQIMLRHQDRAPPVNTQLMYSYRF